MCIRYVDLKTRKIEEAFLSYRELEKATAESVFNTIVDVVEEGGLNLGNSFL